MIRQAHVIANESTNPVNLRETVIERCPPVTSVVAQDNLIAYAGFEPPPTATLKHTPTNGRIAIFQDASNGLVRHQHKRMRPGAITRHPAPLHGSCHTGGSNWGLIRNHLSIFDVVLDRQILYAVDLLHGCLVSVSRQCERLRFHRFW